MGIASAPPRALGLLLAVLAGAAACGGEPPGRALPAADAPPPPTAGPLAAARAAIRSGAVPAAAVEAVEAAGDPRSVRAGHMLRAVEAAFAGGGGGDAKSEPRLTPAPTGAPGAGQGGRSATDGARSPSAGPGTASRPDVRRIDLRRGRGRRVLLSVRAPGGVPIGTVRQPESAFVRLVFHGRAAPSLRLPPRHVGGVHLAGVRKGTESVTVTLRLDPGWRLLRHRRTDRGAIAVFEGPPAP